MTKLSAVLCVLFLIFGIVGIANATSPCEGDFDCDGDVDGSDLTTFAADFGRTDCPPNAPAPVSKTGQTTTYVPGDDGEHERGATWPDPRFTDHEDGTVTDELTGLMWTKAANNYGPRIWNEALADCTGASVGDYTDWYLPNVRELQSLINYGQYNPALPAGHPFTGVQSDYYWTSTTYARYITLAWSVSFYEGQVYTLGKDGAFYVWCVRGGP